MSSGTATSGYLQRAPSAFRHGVGMPAARVRSENQSAMVVDCLCMKTQLSRYMCRGFGGGGGGGGGIVNRL